MAGIQAILLYLAEMPNATEKQYGSDRFFRTLLLHR